MQNFEFGVLIHQDKTGLINYAPKTKSATFGTGSGTFLLTKAVSHQIQAGQLLQLPPILVLAQIAAFGQNTCHGDHTDTRNTQKIWCQVGPSKGFFESHLQALHWLQRSTISAIKSNVGCFYASGYTNLHSLWSRFSPTRLLLACLNWILLLRC